MELLVAYFLIDQDYWRIHIPRNLYEAPERVGKNPFKLRSRMKKREANVVADRVDIMQGLSGEELSDGAAAMDVDARPADELESMFPEPMAADEIEHDALSARMHAPSKKRKAADISLEEQERGKGKRMRTEDEVKQVAAVESVKKRKTDSDAASQSLMQKRRRLSSPECDEVQAVEGEDANMVDQGSGDGNPGAGGRNVKKGKSGMSRISSFSPSPPASTMVEVEGEFGRGGDSRSRASKGKKRNRDRKGTGLRWVYEVYERSDGTEVRRPAYGRRKA